MARLSSVGNRVKPVASRFSSAVGVPERAGSTQRGYGYRWQQARVAYLRKHPLCVHCEAEGMFTIATDLDHKVPHKGDSTLFWDRDNWQGLCKSHHSRKTAAEDGGYGNPGRGGV